MHSFQQPIPSKHPCPETTGDKKALQGLVMPIDSSMTGFYAAKYHHV